MHDDTQHPVAFMYTTHYGSIGYPSSHMQELFPYLSEL